MESLIELRVTSSWIRRVSSGSTDEERRRWRTYLKLADGVHIDMNTDIHRVRTEISSKNRGDLSRILVSHR